MLLDFFIRFFVNRLSAEQCVKLYATLLMSKDSTLSRNVALDRAFFAETKDLKQELRHVIEYGPN